MPSGGTLYSRGVKQFQIQSETGPRVCSAGGVSKQGLGNGLWMVLEENVVYVEASSPGTMLEMKD